MHTITITQNPVHRWGACISFCSKQTSLAVLLQIGSLFMNVLAFINKMNEPLVTFPRTSMMTTIAKAHTSADLEMNRADLFPSKTSKATSCLRWCCHTAVVSWLSHLVYYVVKDAWPQSHNSGLPLSEIRTFAWIIGVAVGVLHPG